MARPIPNLTNSLTHTAVSNSSVTAGVIIAPATSLYGDVLVSTGVVRLDKRAVAPNHDKMGNF